MKDEHDRPGSWIRNCVVKVVIGGNGPVAEGSNWRACELIPLVHLRVSHINPLETPSKMADEEGSAAHSKLGSIASGRERRRSRMSEPRSQVAEWCL